MAESNPYQPPQITEQSRDEGVKRSRLSAGMILLLAPVATYVAFFVGCSAVFLLYNAILRLDQSYRTAVASTLLIGPPATVFVAMLWWAVRSRGRNEQSGRRTV